MTTEPAHDPWQERYGFAGNIASAALLIVGQIAFTLFGSVLDLFQSMNVDGCSPERSCDFTLLTFAGLLPLVAGAVIVVVSLALTVYCVAKRRRAWVVPLVGLGIVLLLVPSALVLIRLATRS